MQEQENQTQSKAAADLPMSVTLQGNEPYFGEFSMDAETVMEKLGIKRSRLRQISGFELRVGRKRVERYIKPFYRSEDVDSYLSWTRQTATHKKSSEALQSAARELSELKDDLLSACMPEYILKIKELESVFRDSLHHFKDQQCDLRRQQIKSLLKLRLYLQQQAEQVRDYLAEEYSQKTKVAESVARLAHSIESTNTYLATELAKIRAELLQLNQATAGSIEQVEQTVMTVKNEICQRLIKQAKELVPDTVKRYPGSRPTNPGPQEVAKKKMADFTRKQPTIKKPAVSRVKYGIRKKSKP